MTHILLKGLISFLEIILLWYKTTNKMQKYPKGLNLYLMIKYINNYRNS